MESMLLEKITDLSGDRNPLKQVTLPDPVPGEDEVLIRVSACGVCHTELDEIEGRTSPPRFPVIPGHQVVGTVIGRGKSARSFQTGERVGVGWIYSSCGTCEFCRQGLDNLCPEFRATGRDADGGYATLMTVPETSAYAIPSVFSDAEAAPLLCAGAIGYRSLRLAEIKNGDRLGLTGFGASAHLVLKMVGYEYPQTDVFVFARSEKEQTFARELGAVWAGTSDAMAPERLHAVIDTTPVWKPVVEAMKNLESGGRLVINAIRKESIDKEYLLNLEYPSHLWMEKEIKSVANVSRGDISAFLTLAGRMAIKPEYQEFPLEEANRALLELKERKIRGAKVLRIDSHV
ncbi:MAG: zinc-dependent alcohol dehydrogenase family protein [Deltaproteobacteria bacterium]